MAGLLLTAWLLCVAAAAMAQTQREPGPLGPAPTVDRPASQRLGTGLPVEMVATDEMPAEPAIPIMREPLGWTRNPGAFEQELRRRYANPLFPPERRVVGAAEVLDAKIRDANDARELLSEVVDLSLDRDKLARAESLDEMRPAMDRYQTLLVAAMGISGEATPLGEALRRGRAALMEQWRLAHAGSPEVLAALDELEDSGQLDTPESSNAFVAQMIRRNGPISAAELTPSLLSEPPETIAAVLGALEERRRADVRREGLALLRSLQGQGIEIEGGQEKIDVLMAGDPGLRRAGAARAP